MAQSTERSEGRVALSGKRVGCIFFIFRFVRAFYACRNSTTITTGVLELTSLFNSKGLIFAILNKVSVSLTY